MVDKQVSLDNNFIENNKILDYEQVLDKLEQIIQKGIIKKIENIGTTEYGLPIEQYLVGKGKNHVVITGATHGCEIITTDFVLNLMNEISNKYQEWKATLEDITIHFIPILNPEGYLISTSAIRKLIPRDMSLVDAEKICKEYYLAYKNDDIEDSKVKLHQVMFKKVNYDCIPDKYSAIKSSVKNIYEKYPDLPAGCLQTWSTNANGIDIQANSEYNPANKKIENGENIFMKSKRSNNINTAHPGPINCPYDNEKGSFKYESETKALSNLLDRLNEKNGLLLYLNYHSSGGMIFQRPAIKPDGLNVSKQQIWQNEVFNYLCARTYAEKTVRDKGSGEIYRVFPLKLPVIKNRADMKNPPETNVIINNDTATSTNDIFRLKYPADLLIELSAMGGNPIGPYGDIKGNYTNVMESNLIAVKQLLDHASIMKMISEECVKVFSKFGNAVEDSDGKEYQIKAQLLDRVFIEYMEKVKMFEKMKKSKNLCKHSNEKKNEVTYENR